MTKQKIIEMICATCIKDENGIPFILDYNAIADTLLALIEQEKKEAIIQAKIEQINACAEEWKSEVKHFEQEKKEVAKEIFNRIFDDDSAGDLGEFCGYGWIYDIYEAKAIAKEYGVDLYGGKKMTKKEKIPASIPLEEVNKKKNCARVPKKKQKI